MLQKQLLKIKENWLLILIILGVFLFFSQWNAQPLLWQKQTYGASSDSMIAERGVVPWYEPGFAPEVEERKITQTITMQTEVQRGIFEQQELQLKSIISSNKALLLQENVNTYDNNYDEIKEGSYQFKVPADKASTVITQLKTLGEVLSYTDNSQDITAGYVDTKIELTAQKERLVRYQKMLEEAETTADKIQLVNLIFEQERSIKYLQDSLTQTDQQVEYVTIYFIMREKASEYAGIALTTLGDLVRALVGSINSLLMLVVAALPYLILIIVGWIIYRKVK